MSKLKAIRELGYDFNAEGQLRKIGANGCLSNEPFQFNVSNDHLECQAHYEQLGAAVTEHIYQLLEKEENLLRLPVPVEAPESSTFIFASKDYETKDVLLILIQGTGAVRAGQWARS
ncbi:unnamed protein product [Leptidea sinapis]|uniref:Arb2 domain-containing protein n=1 Tax=Leptidea sinapis TaxID=189913 RepID=A0A5E4QJW3_9NEOP|nr:unnamed protein product [Leptidea sinapis]